MNILIIPILAGKPWNGATLFTEALGGSESAVAYLARSLARRQHEVHVITHGQPGVYDGVIYEPPLAVSSLMARNWDALISSRDLEVLKGGWKASCRLFWSHDLPHSPNLSVYAHRAVFLTEYHKNTWFYGPNYEGFCRIIGNAVDMALFRGPEVPRNENALVWMSNPDRGLCLAARIFQDIRQRWPDLELHVYGRSSVYGWGPDAEQPFLPLPEHMENVFLHDPLNKVGIAKVLREAWAMFYPTYWPETYCIAALEAQAAGTPVIAPPFAGLVETVKGGVLTYDFLNAISQLRNKSKWQKESQQGLEFAETRDWDAHVVDEWLALISEVQNAEPKPG